MIDFFLLSLPIFAVMGAGCAATRTRLVAQGALDALSAFSLQFALPALVLRLIAGQPLRQSFNPSACAGMLIVVMICDTGERYVSSALFGFD